VIQPVSDTSDVPAFFNRKVVKPVKGGGKGAPTVNPYGSGFSSTVAIKPASQPLSFGDFMSKTSQQSSSAKSKTKV
jgi:hypothetical protein